MEQFVDKKRIKKLPFYFFNVLVLSNMFYTGDWKQLVTGQGIIILRGLTFFEFSQMTTRLRYTEMSSQYS